MPQLTSTESRAVHVIRTMAPWLTREGFVQRRKKGLLETGGSRVRAPSRFFLPAARHKMSAPVARCFTEYSAHTV